MERDYNIQQELENKGIEYDNFKKFYEVVFETKKLPSRNIIPGVQYNTILDYLKTNSVIGKDNGVLEEGLKSFENRLESDHRQKVNDILNRLKNKEDMRNRFYDKFRKRF